VTSLGFSLEFGGAGISKSEKFKQIGSENQPLDYWPETNDVE
jgi:hypothetical protein